MLPVRIAPGYQETFDSWLDRVASACAVTVAALLRAADSARMTGGPRKDVFGVGHRPELLRGLERLVGLRAGVLDPTLLQQLIDCGADPTKPNSRVVYANTWVTPTRSRGCPLCLAERPEWRLTWRSAYHGVCLRHSVMLRDDCPACERPLRLSHGVTPRSSGVPQPDRCGNGTGGTRCHMPLGDMPPGPRVTVAEVVAQADLIAALNGEKAMVAGEVPVSVAEQLTVFRMTSALVRRTYPPGEYPPMSRPASRAASDAYYIASLPEIGMAHRPVTMRPDSAALIAAANVLTSQVLGQPTPDLLAELIDESVRRDRSAHRPVWKPDNSLAPEWWTHIWASTEAARRHHRRWKRILDGPSPSTLPGRLPPGAMIWFDGLIPFRNPDRRSALAAAAVARVLGATSWMAAAEAIGVPAREYQLVTGYPAKACQLAGQEAALERAARTAVEHIGNWCLHDYGQRRKELEGLVDLPEEPIVEALRRAGSSFGRDHLRVRYITMWVWAEYTRGDFRCSPAFQRHVAESKRESLVAGFRRWEGKARSCPNLLSYLFAYCPELH